MNAAAPPTPAPGSRWQRFGSAFMRGFHAYANWLVGISWTRFTVLAVALLVIVAIVHDQPPFTWTLTERVQDDRPRVVRPAKPPRPPKAAPAPKPPAETGSEPTVRIEAPGRDGGVEISIGSHGVTIGPRRAAGAASAASAAPAAPGAAASAAAKDGTVATIRLPAGEIADAVREALEEARAEIESARAEAEAARAEAEAALVEASEPRWRTRTTRIGIGDLLMQFTVLWVVASIAIKITYKGRIQAEAKAAQATETAEAESLRRQVVEARMAAMQAQVEPHFLFNTLASIDHLIETDPARASQMQKNLIALLRASMPTMREAGGNGGNGGLRDLAREMAVIRPYLEILKVRMEERLQTQIDVPDGLLSAEFPPMMIQTLVENAIKHGLEPKADGGCLRVVAEIVHGKLQVTVADTGLGFGRAATAGTGVGLANIRERLQMLYGPKATLTVSENQPSGTVVRITVPYQVHQGSGE